MRRNCFFFCGSLSLFRMLLFLFLLLDDDDHLNVEVIVTLTMYTYVRQKSISDRYWSSDLSSSLSLSMCVRIFLTICPFVSLKAVDQHYFLHHLYVLCYSSLIGNFESKSHIQTSFFLSSFTQWSTVSLFHPLFGIGMCTNFVSAFITLQFHLKWLNDPALRNVYYVFSFLSLSPSRFLVVISVCLSVCFILFDIFVFVYLTISIKCLLFIPKPRTKV